MDADVRGLQDIAIISLINNNFNKHNYGATGTRGKKRLNSIPYQQEVLNTFLVAEPTNTYY